MLKLESLPNCLICDNKVRNKPVRRYVDEVGRVVTAHTCCVRVENKIEKLTNELDNLKKNSCGCSCRQ